MTTKVMSNELALEAFTTQLRSLSAIDDNQTVERIRKVPEGWEIHITKTPKGS